MTQNNKDIYVKEYHKLKILEKTKKVKLNIGCGYQPKKGYINTDIYAHKYVDVICTFENLPFKNNKVDLIYARHVLEHVKDFEKSIKEVYRTLSSKGIFYCIVPHYRSYAAAHPTHNYFFNIMAFDILAHNPAEDWKVTFEIKEKNKFLIISKKYRFQKVENIIKKGIYSLIKYLANNHKIIYEKNIAHIFPPYEIEFILKKP